MKILIVLASYRAGAGDQAAYAYRLATGLAELGHDVTILSSERARPWPAEKGSRERVVLAPAPVRLGGLLCPPTLSFRVAGLMRQHDVVNLHLPQWGAALSAVSGVVNRKPLVLTYHHDPNPPQGWFNALIGCGIRLSAGAAVRLSDRIVCDTDGVAASTSLPRSSAEKIDVVPPPAQVEDIGDGAVAAFRKMHELGDTGPVIGMVARVAKGSGVEVLLNALPSVLETYSEARVLFAGQFLNVVGEERHAQQLSPLLRRFEDHWTFLGPLRPVQLAAFYRNLDVIVAPSLVRAECHALAQIEAMLCGTPSVASDVPGVRHPVERSGMGVVVPRGDSEALAKAIVEVADHREAYVRPAKVIAQEWSTERTAKAYEGIFEHLLKRCSTEDPSEADEAD